MNIPPIADKPVRFECDVQRLLATQQHTRRSSSSGSFSGNDDFDMFEQVALEGPMTDEGNEWDPSPFDYPEQEVQMTSNMSVPPTITTSAPAVQSHLDAPRPLHTPRDLHRDLSTRNMDLIPISSITSQGHMSEYRPYRDAGGKNETIPESWEAYMLYMRSVYTVDILYRGLLLVFFVVLIAFPAYQLYHEHRAYLERDSLERSGATKAYVDCIKHQLHLENSTGDELSIALKALHTTPATATSWAAKLYSVMTRNVLVSHQVTSGVTSAAAEQYRVALGSSCETLRLRRDATPLGRNQALVKVLAVGISELFDNLTWKTLTSLAAIGAAGLMVVVGGFGGPLAAAAVTMGSGTALLYAGNAFSWVPW